MRQLKEFRFGQGYFAGCASSFPEFIITYNGQLKDQPKYNITLFNYRKVKDLDADLVDDTIEGLKTGKLSRQTLDELAKVGQSMTVDRDEAFSILCVDGTMNPTSFRKYLGEMPDHDVDDIHVIFSDALSERNKEKCLHLLHSVKDILERHDASFIYSGKVMFSSTLRDNGLYYPTARYLAISSKIPNEEIAITDILHEFGHKFFFEDLDAEDRNALKEDFEDLLSDHPPVNDATRAGVEVGDVLTFTGKSPLLRHGNKRFIVTGLKDDVVTYKPEDGPITHNGKTYRGFQSRSGELRNGQWLKDGKALVSIVKADVWFPSIYSTKNHEEWWAELFCHFMMDLLTGESKKFVKDVLDLGKVA